MRLFFYYIQSNEVSSSNQMELEGLKRCSKGLQGLNIKAFITDGHVQIAKWIREIWKIPHFLD